MAELGLTSSLYLKSKLGSPVLQELPEPPVVRAHRGAAAGLHGQWALQPSLSLPTRLFLPPPPHHHHRHDKENDSSRCVGPHERHVPYMGHLIQFHVTSMGQEVAMLLGQCRSWRGGRHLAVEFINIAICVFKIQTFRASKLTSVSLWLLAMYLNTHFS